MNTRPLLYISLVFSLLSPESVLRAANNPEPEPSGNLSDASLPVTYEAELTEPVTSAEPVVASPLVSPEEVHGRLFISAFDPEHQLYPVKLISIDKWQLTEDIREQDLRLSEGEHEIRVIPDFSGIEPQKVFMTNTWQEKRLSFSLQQQQTIVIGARLIDTEELQWEVQLFLVELPVEESSEINSYQIEKPGVDTGYKTEYNSPPN